MYDVTTRTLCPTQCSAAHLRQELDRLVEQAWEPGWAPMMLGELLPLCATLRQDAEGWAATRDLLRAHPIHRLMQEDPLVCHASGPEPVWLDLLLGHARAAPLLAQASRAGRDLFAVTRGLPWPAALRSRTAFLGRMAAAVVAGRREAEILTLGAGHLCEAATLGTTERPARWSVLERDAEARRVLHQALPAGIVGRSLRCSLKGFARQPYGAGSFDLVCLPQLPATGQQELIEAAFRVLRPGGWLVLCTPGRPSAEAAWMDAFLGQEPAWGTLAGLEALLGPLGRMGAASCQAFANMDGTLLHARVRRQG